MNQKSKMPQIGEAVFCVIYLVFGYIAGGLMLANTNGARINIVLGILTVVLAGGDSFHLVPRILNAFKKRFDTYEFWAGLGLMISSITMTIFYILLYDACELLIEPNRAAAAHGLMFYILFVLAIIRIAVCLLPQNNWFRKEGAPKWSLIRNAPFVLVGAIAVYGCFAAGQTGMAMAVIISFMCYLPVVIWAKKKPMVGMLMIPKTIAYMWIIGIALGIVF